MATASFAVSVRSEAGVIVGVDLAESRFQPRVADAAWHRRESQRPSRSQLDRGFVNRALSRVAMEAGASAHSWVRCGVIR